MNDITDFTQLIDPELLPALQVPDELQEIIFRDPITARAIFADRENIDSQLAIQAEVTISERIISGPNGDIRLFIYEPATPAPRPALLWIHGGGYFLGSARDDMFCIPFADHARCTVVSVDYRLAPEHPFPAGPEDCYSALQWIASHSDELGIDPKRIAIGGASAGGGMAAGVALMNRDRGGVPVVLQLLLYPMIDDSHDTPSGHAITSLSVWNRKVSLYAWGLYLGNLNGKDVSPYAAAARATDVSGLPPTYLCVGTLDLFRDEIITYAQRLMAANIPTELVVYPRVTHAAEGLAPDAEVSYRMRANYIDALKRALAGPSGETFE
jgi:acetyl esterase/lipase